MSESIAGVVVTYNRKLLLVECLIALLNQTRKLDRIYIIDQGSTDGTTDLLLERGFLAESLIEYRRSPVNTGGAGGFHDGMQKAYRDGYSWVWIMDDDAIPDSDACERMIPLTCFPGVVAVANNKLRRDRAKATHHTVMLHEKKGPFAGYCRLKFSSFVGLLVKREAIDLIGLPKAEFFFQFDDNEYCARLLTRGDIAYAADSYIVHKEADPAFTPKKFFGWSFSRVPAEQYWRCYFSLRNNLWRLVHTPGRPNFWGLLRYSMSIITEIPAAFLLDRDQPITRLYVMYRAVSDALHSRFDNQFGFYIRERMTGRSRRRKAPLHAPEVSKTSIS
jgi:rhamnopyranosyl-N-acetylglucosaminyl-diphospho-decaprenol beta-1,3/1,4-galactofuranosyltransferase